ncbi:hypothetical protein GCM10023194_42490 [Planotetraspora phitsanulokensis]|uniref:Uncharacterized protein n=1 Tax=Planotetraspora phitsanulokensis TaxID=575192 RepID=A0A8J3XF38_9ACTN|nr:hypothetical protein [Planotetraspora phitsanulokensis]GII37851.1 hypothetical protein Pph01_28540 [Planotetraspora phitsanulokensis]
MTGDLRPQGPASAGDRRLPATVLSWDGDRLVASDEASGRSVRLPPGAPRTLSCYSFTRERGENEKKKKDLMVFGLAVLDADRLVLLDLPGRWGTDAVSAFAAAHGLTFQALGLTPARARTLLSCRAPGWGVLRGLPEPAPASRGRRFAWWSVALSGLVAMVCTLYFLPPHMWRFFRLAVTNFADVLELKWLALAASPLGVLIAPLFQRLDRVLLRRRVSRGRGLAAADRPSAARLGVRGRKLAISGMGPGPRSKGVKKHPLGGLRMLIYRCEGLNGLFVLDATDCPVYHFPGRWHPEDVNRFAARHGITCEIRELPRREYAVLATAARDAYP